MIRLDGNTILVVDTDKVYGTQLKEVLSIHGGTCFFASDIASSKDLLKKYDFDLVISNYYLVDGLIHQIIDWSAKTLSYQPIFTCIGYPLPADSDLSQKQSIADVFSKSDFSRMLSGISYLLFDFDEFQKSLNELVAPEEIKINLKAGDRSLVVSPLEISSDKVFLLLDEEFNKGTFGILKFSFVYEKKVHDFVIPGLFEGKFSGGQVFKISSAYNTSWNRFLNFLHLRQLTITGFLKKAAGN
jgi:hypothetical protein